MSQQSNLELNVEDELQRRKIREINSKRIQKLRHSITIKPIKDRLISNIVIKSNIKPIKTEEIKSK